MMRMSETRISGGGSGIRTHDTVSRIHAFQACAFSHSATPPGTRNRAQYSDGPCRYNPRGIRSRSGWAHRTTSRAIWRQVATSGFRGPSLDPKSLRSDATRRTGFALCVCGALSRVKKPFIACAGARARQKYWRMILDGRAAIFGATCSVDDARRESKARSLTSEKVSGAGSVCCIVARDLMRLDHAAPPLSPKIIVARCRRVFAPT
jgi:hypothetical protein